MDNLSQKSTDELRELLDEYGIKHGPIVDSTRSLYEKKLREAMTKAKKSASDKTYYREEVEEEVTYVTRTPVRGVLRESGAYMRSRPEVSEREYQQEASHSNYFRSPPDFRREDYVHEPSRYSTPTTSYRSSYLSSTPVTSKDIQSPSAPPSSASPKSSGLVPPWFQVLFFIVVLIFLYIVFSSMEANEPIKGIE